MKLRHGGFTPLLGGRPSSRVEELPAPSSLVIDLTQQGLNFKPIVSDGRQVAYGDEIAASEGSYGRLVIAAPASGTVTVPADGDTRQIIISNVVLHDDAAGGAPGFEAFSPERISRSKVRESLVRAGVWQSIWSQAAAGIPHVSEADPPRVIVVNTIFTEPFRARGKVIIDRSWDMIIHGIRFLQHLAADYGKIEIVLTAPNDPLAKKMYSDLAGLAWVRFHPVPLRYPVEHPQILSTLLRGLDRHIQQQNDVWVLGVQDVESVGSVLASGLPPRRRIIAVGGPGSDNPRHVSAVIGTRIDQIVSGDGVAALRGGIMNGEPVDPAQSGVSGRDDALFMLPETESREMFGFVRPGFTRTSYSRTFVSRLLGTKDTHITASIRGERRPCIACGACEVVCPVQLLPQVMHRYLYNDRIDDADRVGLMHCIDCRLCTYVCPSKIDLQHEFTEARTQLIAEREEARSAAAEAAAKLDQGEESREDWHEAPKKDS
ncbi:MAG: 4Fe-4S dicluster domain-containing protein [Spirochaetia bacterium]